MALEAIRSEKTLAELSAQYEVHVNQISQWRSQLLDGASTVFGADKGIEDTGAVDLTKLHAKIGQLTLENDFLSSALGKAGFPGAKK